MQKFFAILLIVSLKSIKEYVIEKVIELLLDFKVTHHLLSSLIIHS